MSKHPMRLKPIRFVGHKLGPFEHIELDWEQDSRYTLIVAENGMGKTTLVAAIAACLAVGNSSLTPDESFYRFAQDRTAYAYLEVDIEGERGAILRWASEYPDQDPKFDPYSLSKNPSQSPLMQAVTNSHILTLTRNLQNFTYPWSSTKSLRALAAAYGVNRDISHYQISESRDLDSPPLHNILNSYEPPSSKDILQWINNRYTQWAFALVAKQEEEAKSYIDGIQRVENVMKELGMSISFEIERNPFRLAVKRNGTSISVDQLSHGTRSFMGWALDYLMRASRVNWTDPVDSANPHGLILIDEIDSHLHPEWQRKIMAMVNQLLPNTYIVATTHSPFVLGAADDAQVFRIYKDDQGKLQVTSSLDEFYGYPADLILEKAFVPSLYPPEIEEKMTRLSVLAQKVASKTISVTEKRKHDELLRELAEVSPWLNTLLALSQANQTKP